MSSELKLTVKSDGQTLSNQSKRMLFFLNACFTFNYMTLKSIHGQACDGCINHDIVVGLCSKLLMRSSYYIHRAYVK